MVSASSKSFRSIFTFGLTVALLALGVVHFITLGVTIDPAEWVVLYVLVGFIGGAMFYLIDPLSTQDFKWKGIATLSGGAATGAAFMLIAKALTPDRPPPDVEHYSPAVAVIRSSVQLDNGVKVKLLDVRSLSDDNLSRMFGNMLTAIGRERQNDLSTEEQLALLRAFLREVSLSLGVASPRMRVLADEYLKRPESETDEEWEKIIKEHIDGHCPGQRKECTVTFNRIPYAIYTIGDAENARIGVALPGSVVRVDKEEYEVITFANPRNTLGEQVGLRTPMFEGIVLRPKAGS